MNKPKRPHAGFTLIELMIVVAIIAMMSTMALPSFQDRAIKAQVSEGLNLAEFVKQGVSAYYSRNKQLPANNAAAALPPANKIMGNFVTQVNVDHGAITITYGNRANAHLAGKKLTLQPAVVAGYPAVPIAWVCGRAGAPGKMTVQGRNATNIPQPHLPLECAR